MSTTGLKGGHGEGRPKDSNSGYDKETNQSEADEVARS